MAVVHRRVALPPVRESARAARRLLREIVHDVGRDDWLDCAELALSEVVTNATLHAHTEIEVLVDVSPEVLCVQVRDHDKTLPIERHYGEEAVTGRGLGLVAAVTQRCGVQSLGEAGKVVWFCVGDDKAGITIEDLIDAWASDLADKSPLDDNTVSVVLQALPVKLWLAAREHHDAMLRDLCHHLAARGSHDADLEAADRARSTISATLVGVLRQVAPEPAQWPATFDLVVSVPTDGGWRFSALQDALDLAEALAVEGLLLLQPGLPEIVAVRDWACEQVIAQLAGAPPSPWPGTAQPRFETEVRDHKGPVADWDATVVTEADRPVLAADEANRIVAVSRPAADLLGWECDELVGRRVVTIVPPDWREAHVAGFTRHISTGESRVLGVPTELPVLAADGSEVPCRLLIELLPNTGSRTIYAAWIDPITPGGTTEER
ncbi:MAG TPA: PAS domain S-box protein [Acidimicrobiales bacterium]|nr:PAS domain S-box protein [Acidimicrobiales bacterium]